jgi:Zn-dependent peptidase ImmA (M78 family)
VFKRGFKSWCENTSVSLRTELNLGSADALDPYKLAAHLNIIVWKLEEIPGVPVECVTVLLADSDSWSAATVRVGIRNAVILNSGHSPARMNSDFMHELSHLVLAHTAARVDISEDGILLLSNYDRVQEDEANWLAGCLLLPRESLYLARRKRLSVEAISAQYGASKDMVNFRLNVTGVDHHLRRTAKKVTRA